MLDPKMKATDIDVRSYFAAMAMQGLLAHSCDRDFSNASVDKLGQASLRAADALIAELNKEQK